MYKKITFETQTYVGTGRLLWKLSHFNAEITFNMNKNIFEQILAYQNNLDYRGLNK